MDGFSALARADHGLEIAKSNDATGRNIENVGIVCARLHLCEILIGFGCGQTGRGILTNSDTAREPRPDSQGAELN
eukprot:jgi/Picsp_1/6022/NSC_03376-R1_---NA---